MLSVDLIRQKFKTYSKRNRFRRILSNPDLKVYYDAALYRNLLPDGETTDDIYLFPNAISVEINDALEPADVTDGELRLGNSGDAIDAAYKEKGLSDPDILDSLAEVFATRNWGIVAVFINVDLASVGSALFDMTDGNGGYCRLEVDADNRVLFRYKGDFDANELVSSIYDLEIDNDIYMFASMQDGDLKVYLNGTLALDETVAEIDYAALTPVNFALGGVYDGSTIDTVVSCRLAMLAMFSGGLNANEKARYDNHVSLFYPSATFEAGVVEIPAFTLNPAIVGDAEVGSVLSLNAFTYDGVGVVETYQWFVASPPTAIGGATNDTFTPTGSELAQEVYCEVTLTNRAGSVTVATPAVGPIISP